MKRVKKLKRNMGMNEAPFGPIGLKPGPGCRKFRGASFGRGDRGPGGWGFGKKLENVIFSDIFDMFEFIQKKE